MFGRAAAKQDDDTGLFHGVFSSYEIPSCENRKLHSSTSWAITLRSGLPAPWPALLSTSSRIGEAAGGRRLQARGHLAGVHRIDPRVRHRRVQEDRRVLHAVADTLVRRVGGQPAGRHRIVGRAILGNPERGDAEEVVAEHVEQRHAADDGAKQLRALSQRGTDEEAAVGATRDRQPIGRRHPLCDEPARRGDEVVEHVLLVAEHAGAVPALAVLAAAAQDRQRVGPTALEKGDRRGGPGGQHVDVEAAVAGEQGRVGAIAQQPLAMREKKRHAGAVARADHHPLHLEGGRIDRRLERPPDDALRRRAQPDVEDRGRREEAGEPVEELGDVARGEPAERGQRAEPRQRDLTAQSAGRPFEGPHVEDRQARGGVVQEADREVAVKVDRALQHVVPLGDHLAPVGARRLLGVDREDPPARSAAGGEKVDAIVERLDDVEPGVLAGRHGDRWPGCARGGPAACMSKRCTSLLVHPCATLTTSQRPSGERSTLGQSVRSRPSPKSLGSCAGSLPR